MTVKDISAQTGYSVGTVSRVLNNQPNVSPKARRVILEAAKASGFQLNVNAKQLKQQRSNTVLAVVKGRSNELFGNLIEAMQEKMSQLPYPLVVDYLDEDDNEVLRGVQLCREKKPRGMLFLGGNLENFRNHFAEIDIPCVLVTNDASALQEARLSSVTTDDKMAGFLAVEHLAKLGHKNIAVIGGWRGVSDISSLRYRGCLEAVEKYGLPFDGEKDYFEGRFSYTEGYRAVETLLQSGRQFTAIFAMADVMAIGAVRALQDKGYKVPEDVSVIGVDGLQIGEFTLPRLSTVCQSVDQLAQESVALIARQIEGNAQVRHLTIAPEVAHKESTKQV